MTSPPIVARTPSHKRRRQHQRRRLIAAAVAVVALFGLLFLADGLVFRGRIHHGVTISGVSFGRAAEGEAVQELRDLVEQAQAEPLILVREENRWPVLPDEFGASVDVAETVAEALAVTRDGNLFQDLAKRVSLYFKKQDIALKGGVDQGKMDKIITMVAEKLDDPPVNAGLRFSGHDIVVVEDKDGFVVDQDTLRDSLTTLLLSLHSSELEIPMVTAVPNIRAADTAGAVAEARTMISTPVKLTHGDASWTMSAEQIKNSLDFTVTVTAGTERLTSYISPDKAGDFLGAVNQDVKIDPKKATWEADGQTASVIPAVVGKSLDYQKTADALTTAARATTNRTAKASLKEVQPERTTEQAQEMGIVSAVGKFTTEFSGSQSRVSNIQHAAQLIHNWLLAPGDVFSFNSVVGQRTEDRGFRSAPVINSKGQLEDDLGGGICQVATTLFNAAFFAGLEIVERQNHSLYIDHYPMGRDAAVSWGWPDLKFRNDTDHWLLVRSYADSSSVTFVIYGTPDGREVTYSTSDWYDIVAQTEEKVETAELAAGETRVKDYGQTGRSCTVTRTVRIGGSVISKDTFPSVYPMYPKTIEVGTKVPETTTTTAVTSTTTRPTTTSSPSTTSPTTTTTVEQ